MPILNKGCRSKPFFYSVGFAGKFLYGILVCISWIWYQTDCATNYLQAKTDAHGKAYNCNVFLFLIGSYFNNLTISRKC